MTPFTPADAPDFLSLAYRPDLHVLVSRWQRPVSRPEFRAGYRATLALAETVGCPYWQVDLRGRNAAEPATQQWLTTKFLPRVAHQMASPVYMGYLLTPQLLRQLAPASEVLSAAMTSPETDCRVAFFSEEGPLATWLTGCQHRGAAELARAGFVGPG